MSENWTPPGPPLTESGFINALELGPTTLRRIADLVTAISALGEHGLGQEGELVARCVEQRGQAFLGDAIAIYYADCMDDTNPAVGLIGWIAQVDGATWAFHAAGPRTGAR